MGLPPLPQVLDLVALTDAEVSLGDGVGPAVVQDSAWSLQVQVVDQNGDAFDLGPTVSPLWTFESQLRQRVYDEDSTADLSFTCAVDDGPLGLVTVSATAAQTAVLRRGGGRWDLQMTNDGDPGYASGYRVVLFRGRWSLIQDVTRV